MGNRSTNGETKTTKAVAAVKWLAALSMLAVTAACSTVDDLSPSASAGSEAHVAVRNPRFSDSDPHEWQGGAPWTYAVHGTDVSKYQTSIDWRTAKLSGVSFAFI